MRQSGGVELHELDVFELQPRLQGERHLVDQDAARVLAQEAPQTVINLERSGVAFSRTKDGLIAQRRFGGQRCGQARGPRSYNDGII